MIKKVCFVCEEEKELNFFYKHPKMKDGHLNKCISCSLRQAIERHYVKYKDESFVEYERARNRDKYNRLNYGEKQKEWDANRSWTRDSVYKGLHAKLKRNGLIKSGETAHHYNYNLLKRVFVMDNFSHKHIHTFMYLDKETNCFVDKESGEQIDTIAKNIGFLDLHEIDYKFIAL